MKGKRGVEFNQLKTGICLCSPKKGKGCLKSINMIVFHTLNKTFPGPHRLCVNLKNLEISVCYLIKFEF